MIIEIQRITSQGVEMDFTKPATHFPSLVNLSQQGECEFVSPIVFRIGVRKESDLVIVKGRLSCRVILECSRCLARFESTIQDRFKLRFSRAIPEDVHCTDAEEIELTADEIGLTFFSDDSIDLTESLQEQVLLALPVKALCRPECKGLCHHCGVDLNEKGCICRNTQTNGPFAVLKNMKLKASE